MEKTRTYKVNSCGTVTLVRARCSVCGRFVKKKDCCKGAGMDPLTIAVMGFVGIPFLLLLLFAFAW